MKPGIFVVQPLMEEGLELLREVGEVEVFESDRMIGRDQLLQPGGVRPAQPATLHAGGPAVA